MRRRLIDAAIFCLDRHGYAATTIDAVASKADVSRGALLHHFKTRKDLLTTALRHANVRLSGFMAKAIASHPPGLDRLRALPKITLQMELLPESRACHEVRMASLHDGEIRSKAAPIAAEAMQDQLAFAFRQAVAAGLSVDEELAGLVTAIVMTMRSLATSVRHYCSEDQMEKAVRALANALEATVQRQLDASRQTSRRRAGAHV